MQSVLIAEGAHHLDLMFSNPHDPQCVKDARAMELSTGMRVICDGRLESIRNGTKYVQGLGAALSNWPGHVGSQSAVDLRYNCSAQS